MFMALASRCCISTFPSNIRSKENIAICSSWISTKNSPLLLQSAQGRLQILDVATCSPYELALDRLSLVPRLPAMLFL